MSSAGSSAIVTSQHATMPAAPMNAKCLNARKSVTESDMYAAAEVTAATSVDCHVDLWVSKMASAAERPDRRSS